MSTEKKTEGGAAAPATEGNLLDEILAEAKISPDEYAYGVAKKGVEDFVKEMLGPSHKGAPIDKAVVDSMIAEIDKRMSDQINQILHNDQFQHLESAWRG